MKRFHRPSPAMVVAMTALVVAMAGTGYAATHLKPNSVKSKQIKDGQVKTVDLANAAVTGPKLATDSVTGAKVADGSVTGSDVNEATLGTVPSAVTADNSVLLQGNPASAFAPASKVLTSGQVVMLGNEPQKTLISNGTLRLLADCDSSPGGDRPSLTLKTAAGTTAWYQSTATNPATSSGNISEGSSIVIESFATSTNGGTYNALASDGKSLSGTFIARGGFQGDNCVFSVSAISG